MDTAESIGNSGLSGEEIRAYERDGFVGPFTLVSPEEMASVRERLLPYLERFSPAPTPASDSSDVPRPKRVFNAHLDNKTVHDLVFSSGLVERVASLLGEDLLLWRTAFWVKEPGAAAVNWHQDVHPEFGLDYMRNVSAWIAIDDVTREGGCVQLIRGSHKQVEADFGFSPSEERFVGGDLLPPIGVDSDRIVGMPLEAGQFFLFDQLTIHGSSCNRASRPRMGFAVRVIPPHVRTGIKTDCVVLRGRDDYGHHRLVPARPNLRRRLGRMVAKMRARLR